MTLERVMLWAAAAALTVAIGGLIGSFAAKLAGAILGGLL